MALFDLKVHTWENIISWDKAIITISFWLRARGFCVLERERERERDVGIGIFLLTGVNSTAYASFFFFLPLQ